MLKGGLHIPFFITFVIAEGKLEDMLRGCRPGCVPYVRRVCGGMARLE